MTELTLKKTTARRLYPEAPEWFKKVLNESFGEDFFSERNYTDIKTFEDACNELGIDPDEVFNSNDLPDEVAYKKLKIVVKAINQGWSPDWDNSDQYKYWPYFKLSSGFGFSDSDYYYDNATTSVGSRLCFESEAKCTYAAKQFIDIYEQFLTIKK